MLNVWLWVLHAQQLAKMKISLNRPLVRELPASNGPLPAAQLRQSKRPGTLAEAVVALPVLRCTDDGSLYCKGAVTMVHHVVPAAGGLAFTDLKQKQRAIRDGFPDAVGLRVHRALSWLGRAEKETDDADVRFILLWIGFNAAYAGHLAAEVEGQRSEYHAFFETLVALDHENRIYGMVWSRFSNEIRVLLDNRFVFAPFWKFANGDPAFADWEDRLARSRRAIGAALAARDTPRVLLLVFDRLYVLRNQIVHGGATWNSSINRDQVRDGAAVLGSLLPVFIDIMMDHPDRDWGKPYYPILSDDGQAAGWTKTG